MIETARLLLRPLGEADRPDWAAMSADPSVMQWLGTAPRSRAESDAHLDRLMATYRREGHGWLAVVRREDGAFLGGACLDPVSDPPPVPQGVEIGWRLARSAWGFGYASEAARALLRDGFARLDLPRILAFTATTNARSRAVMARIGMTHRADLDFDHPRLAADHPLRRHVVYVAALGPPGA